MLLYFTQIVILVWFTVIHHSESYIPTQIIGTTRDLTSRNNSLFIMDTETTQLLKRQDFSSVTNFYASAIDVRQREYFLLGAEIWRINAETFLPLRVLPVHNLQNIQYDYSLNKMFGVKVDDKVYRLVEINLNDGTESVIVTLPISSLNGNGFAYDQRNHRYFVSTQEDQNTYVVMFDTTTGKHLNKFAVPKALANLEYDPLAKRLLGISSATLCSIDNLDTQQPVFKELVKLAPEGLPNLYGGAVDPLNNRYLANLRTPGQTQSLWVSVDLSTLEIIFSRKFFADVQNLQLLPRFPSQKIH